MSEPAHEVPRRLFKYLQFCPELEQLFVEHRIKFSAAKDFNDPFDCKIEPLWPTRSLTRLGQKAIERLRGRYGILTLTETPLSVIMWAHYGQNHEGLCIELSTRGHWFFQQAQRVRYSRYYPRFRALKAPVPKQYDKIFLTKSPVWAYEGEWRLITPAGPGNHPFPPAALTGVIFGLRTPESVKSQVRGWLAETASVRVLQTKQMTRSFKLRIVPSR